MFDSNMDSGDPYIEHCYATAFSLNPAVAARPRVEAIEHLHECGQFSYLSCRCFAADLDQRREEVEAVCSPFELDQYLDRFAASSAPYATDDDRNAGVTARCLSGYDDYFFNSRSHPLTTAELEQLAWPQPRFATAPATPDPRTALRAVITCPHGAASMSTRRRAANALKLYNDISSPYCTCFPGNPKTAVRAAFLTWLCSPPKFIPPEAAVCDLIVSKQMKRLKTKTGRNAFPKTAESLDRFTELAQSPREWIPYDLYVALNPPEPSCELGFGSDQLHASH
jgi:hypothetical protein